MILVEAPAQNKKIEQNSCDVILTGLVTGSSFWELGLPSQEALVNCEGLGLRASKKSSVTLNTSTWPQAQDTKSKSLCSIPTPEFGVEGPPNAPKP